VIRRAQGSSGIHGSWVFQWIAAGCGYPGDKSAREGKPKPLAETPGTLAAVQRYDLVAYDFPRWASHRPCRADRGLAGHPPVVGGAADVDDMRERVRNIGVKENTGAGWEIAIDGTSRKYLSMRTRNILR
jgi:hypothetical protein